MRGTSSRDPPGWSGRSNPRGDSLLGTLFTPEEPSPDEWKGPGARGAWGGGDGTPNPRDGTDAGWGGASPGEGDAGDGSLGRAWGDGDASPARDQEDDRRDRGWGALASDSDEPSEPSDPSAGAAWGDGGLGDRTLDETRGEATTPSGSGPGGEDKENREGGREGAPTPVSPPPGVSDPPPRSFLTHTIPRENNHDRPGPPPRPNPPRAHPWKTDWAVRGEPARRATAATPPAPPRSRRLSATPGSEETSSSPVVSAAEAARLRRRGLAVSSPNAARGPNAAAPARERSSPPPLDFDLAPLPRVAAAAAAADSDSEDGAVSDSAPDSDSDSDDALLNEGLTQLAPARPRTISAEAARDLSRRAEGVLRDRPKFSLRRKESGGSPAEGPGPDPAGSSDDEIGLGASRRGRTEGVKRGTARLTRGASGDESAGRDAKPVRAGTKRGGAAAARALEDLSADLSDPGSRRRRRRILIPADGSSSEDEGDEGAGVGEGVDDRRAVPPDARRSPSPRPNANAAAAEDDDADSFQGYDPMFFRDCPGDETRSGADRRGGERSHAREGIRARRAVGGANGGGARELHPAPPGSSRRDDPPSSAAGLSGPMSRLPRETARETPAWRSKLPHFVPASELVRGEYRDGEKIFIAYGEQFSGGEKGGKGGGSGTIRAEAGAFRGWFHENGKNKFVDPTSGEALEGRAAWRAAEKAKRANLNARGARGARR